MSIKEDDFLEFQSKECIEQVLAEIKHYLNPTEVDCEKKEFLMGMLCGLHTALEGYPAYITNKRFIGAIVYVGLEAIKYRE